MGDLLQSIYATVAILLDRLPDTYGQERQLLAELKSRGEIARIELDGIVDLVSPGKGQPSVVHLDSLVEMALIQVRERFPHLAIDRSCEADLAIIADPRLITNAMMFLLLGMCQAGREHVVVRIGRDAQTIRCEIERDGFPVTPEQVCWLQQPFATTQHAGFGLALALVQNVSAPGGGQVSVKNLDSTGVQVLLVFPQSMARSSPASTAE